MRQGSEYHPVGPMVRTRSGFRTSLQRCTKTNFGQLVRSLYLMLLTASRYNTVRPRNLRSKFSKLYTGPRCVDSICPLTVDRQPNSSKFINNAPIITCRGHAKRCTTRAEKHRRITQNFKNRIVSYFFFARR